MNVYGTVLYSFIFKLFTMITHICVCMWMYVYNYVNVYVYAYVYVYVYITYYRY